MAIFCGLDVSLTGTGHCVMIDDKVSFGTIKTVPKDFPNDLERFKYIADAIFEKIPSNTDFIVIEDVYVPHSAQIGSALKLAMLAGVVRMKLYMGKLPFAIMAATQIKKHLTSKGTAPKDQMSKEIYKKYGHDSNDDNQSDAIAMCYMAKDIYTYLKTGECSTCTKAQAEVIKTIHQRPSYNIAVKKTNTDTE